MYKLMSLLTACIVAIILFAAFCTEKADAAICPDGSRCQTFQPVMAICPDGTNDCHGFRTRGGCSLSGYGGLTIFGDWLPTTVALGFLALVLLGVRLQGARHDNSVGVGSGPLGEDHRRPNADPHDGRRRGTSQPRRRG